VRDSVVLVPDADMGERVTVRTDEVRKDFARAETMESESNLE
jgi:predicted RNA-binding protein with TRAM domain